MSRMTIELAMSTELRPVCPDCKGTGKVQRMSFSEPRTLILKSCMTCSGRGFLYLDSEPLTGMVEVLLEILLERRNQ